MSNLSALTYKAISPFHLSLPSRSLRDTFKYEATVDIGYLVQLALFLMMRNYAKMVCLFILLANGMHATLFNTGPNDDWYTLLSSGLGAGDVVVFSDGKLILFLSSIVTIQLFPMFTFYLYATGMYSCFFP